MSFRVPAARHLANSTAAFSISFTNANRVRSFEVQPAAAIGIGVAAGLLLTWYLAATLYFVFRDDVLARILQQQTEMQYAYEDRLAAMRTHLDRVASRQLVDQDSLEAKVQNLTVRHSQLETRQAIVNQLAETAAPGLPKPQAAAAAPLITGSISAYAPMPAKPLPAPDSFTLRHQPPEAQKTLPGRVSQLHSGLDRIEAQQLRSVESLARRARQKGDAFDQVLAETGVPAPAFPSARAAGTGGPLVPISGDSAFEKKVTLLQTQMQRVKALQRTVNALPLIRPIATDVSMSSGYGPRIDPFTRGSAMHTGIDFRAPSGMSVRAAGAGKVIEAGWSGGYGQMVEIDHGNGIATRYAHLSVIHVSAGDSVAKGAHVGNVGSTGRSTGSHLHYEVRVGDEAVDPQRFLRAGAKMPAGM